MNSSYKSYLCLLNKALDEEDGKDLEVQLKVFKDYKDGDFEELAQRYNHI